ncbi:MAG: peptidylprolyl isomerase, partial [Planctomycetia bacterium]
NLALDAIYDLDGPLTYTVECSDPNVMVYVPEGNRSMRMTVSADNGNVSGEMIFELFEQRAPRVTNQMISLAESGFYDGLTFHRILNDFVIQGGDPTGTGSGNSYLGVFDDQFHNELMHTTTGALSMAKAIEDGNDCQFFITEGAQRHLDFNHSVFGQLIEGEDVRADLSDVPANSSTGVPDSTAIMESVEIFEDTENAILVINAPYYYVGSSSVTITVTIHDDQGNDYVQTPINVTIQPDTNSFGYEENSGSYFADFDALRTPVGTPYSVDLSQYIQDVEGIESYAEPDEYTDYEFRTFFYDAYGLYNIIERDQYGEVVYRDAYGNVTTAELGSVTHLEYVPFLENTDLQYSIDFYSGVASFTPDSGLVGTYLFPVATGLADGYGGDPIDKQVAALNLVPTEAPDATLAMTLVHDPTDVDEQGEVDALPASEEWITAWDKCSMEVWAKIDDSGQYGIYSVSTDLSYDADRYEVSDIEWGVGFNQEQTGTIDSETGVITGLGGTTKWYTVIPYGGDSGYPSMEPEDVIRWGDDQYVLVARVNLQPKYTQEELQVQPGTGYDTPVATSFALSQGNVKWNAVDEADVLYAGTVDADIYAVSYDLNGDASINLTDVLQFLGNYQVDIDAPGNEWGYACDFNQDGAVQLSDFLMMLGNYQFTAAGGHVEMPDGFPDLGGSQSASLMGTLTASDLAGLDGDADQDDDTDDQTLAIDQIMLLYGDV